MSGPPDPNAGTSTAAEAQPPARPSIAAPSPPDDPTSAATRSTSSRRLWRRLGITAGIVAVVIGLGAALVLVAPRYVARLVADRYFQGVGVDVEGVKTFDIDLPKGEISLGPVRFQAGGAPPGEVGLFGIELSLRNLFDRQALLERVLIKEVDVEVRQAPDGEISINGVPLRQFLAKTETDQPPPQTPETPKAGSPWGAGIDDLALRNLRIAFTGRTGGTAALTIEHLDLQGFRSWEPNQPGSFVLTGEVNGIDMTATGNARPFADKITVAAEVAFDNVEIAKIETYTGPLGLTSQQGVLTVYARNDLSIFPDGRIEGGCEGSLALNGIDLAKEQAGALKLDQGVLGFDVDYAADRSGIVVTGKTDGTFERLQGTLPDGTGLSSAEVTLDLPDLKLGLPADRSVTLATRPQLTVSELAVSGPADFRAGHLLVQAPALAMTLKPGELTSVRLDGSADGTAGPGLEIQAPTLAEPLAARAEVLRLTMPNLSFEARPDQGSALRIDTAGAGAAAKAGAAKARLELQKPALDGPTEVRMSTLALELGPMALDTGTGGKTALRTNAALSAGDGDVKVAGQSPSPLGVAFATMGLKVADLDLAIDGETTKVAGAIDADAGRLSLVLPQPEESAGAPSRRLAAETWTLALPSLVATATPRGTILQGKGTSAIEALTVAVPMAGSPSPADISVRTTRLTLSALDLAAEPDGSLRLDANLAADLQAVAAAWATGATAPSPPPPPQRARRGRTQPTPAVPAAVAGGETAGHGRVAADRLALAFNKLGLRKSREGDTGLTIGGTGDVGAVTAAIPGTATQGAVDVSLAALRLGFGDLGIALSRNAETSVAGRLDIALDKLAGSQASIETVQRQPMRFAVDRTRIGLADLDVRSMADRLQASGTATADIGGVSADLPEQGVKRPRLQATLRGLRASVGQARYETTSRGLQWSVEVDTLADAISAQASGGKLLTVKMKGVTLQGGRFDQARAVGIDRLAIERPEIFVSREYVNMFTAPGETRIEEAAKEVKEETRTLRLGSFSVNDGGTIRFRDDVVQPNINLEVEIKSLQLQNLNTAAPEERATLLVDATVNQFTQVNMAGWIASPGAKPDFDLNGTVRRLELPPLSPYAAQAIGVNVEGGQLGITAKATAKTGTLAGDIDIILGNLGFSALSAKEAEKLSASLGVPIETIVGLLQNDEGVIRLSLPLSGDMASPSFDLSDAIGQAVSGAVKAAALAPFKLAFLPVSLLANAAGGGGLTFEPILFEAGSNAINANGETMARALADVLKDRRQLRLLVCGKATAADASAVLSREGERASGPGREAAIERLAPQLWSLAGERTAAIRRALVDAGAQPRQVAECRTTFDAADTKPPRVEVTL